MNPDAVRYSKGDRSDEARAAHRDYERGQKRKRERPDGPGPIEYVPALEARNHLRRMAEAGVGVRRIHQLTGLSISTLQLIRDGTRPRIQRRVEDKILGVHLGRVTVDGRRPNRQPTMVATTKRPKWRRKATKR